MAINKTLLKDDFETDYELKKHTFDYPEVNDQTVAMVPHTENNILDDNTRTLTDTLLDDTVQHIIDNAETEGSTNEILYINDQLKSVIDQTVGGLNVISSVVASLPGGGAVTAALQPYIQALTALKTSLSSKSYINMNKNII